VIHAPIYAHNVPNEYDNDKIVCKPAPGAKRKYIHGIAGERARGRTTEKRGKNDENVKKTDTKKGNI
jgi:hypothetical protein